jgi:hypothetical protein
MMTNITYGTFLFFGSSLVVGIFFVYFSMPETRGLSLEEMDILFNIPGLVNKKRAKADKIIEDIRAAEKLVAGEMKNDLEHEHVERQETA